ncbi:MAG: hypothetical protein R3E68_22485 [Burkholderiaceae bacterium]
MPFSQFLLRRVALIEQASRGYGDSIGEKTLYDCLRDLGEPGDGFAVIVDWGLISGLLTTIPTDGGRRFRINRRALARLRQEANGESGSEQRRHPGVRDRGQ